MTAIPTRPRRSLILAGGGLKVAFQAGVLQVWLDEARLEFDHADGASGGTFNLAMYCQGMTGLQIAENWRRMKPTRGISFNIPAYLRLPFAESLLTLDAFRRNVFTSWRLDWDAIRASPREATFNVYNFSRHRLEVLTPERMNEDLLAACVSLPIWFPPVRVNGEAYIDPVYVTDANLEEAIRRGADELWVIWTVSEQGQWRGGFVANYFQIIESAANGQFRGILGRIDRNNAAIAGKEPGEFGRHIEVKILRAEVPVHYLLNLGRDRLVAAVNLGVEAARTWCRAEGIPLGAPVSRPSAPDRTRVSFTEQMRGYISFGEASPAIGYKLGKATETTLSVRFTIMVEGVNRFATEPAHEARISGEIRCDALGGRLPVEGGTFNLFVHEGDPAEKRMRYRVWFRDGVGNELTLLGEKLALDDPGADIWRDTTTLFTRIVADHVGESGGDAETVATGIIRIHLLDFAKQLTTFRASGPSRRSAIVALMRFGQLFFGKLWDVYARAVLSSGPI